jgi:hypothetical protein
MCGSKEYNGGGFPNVEIQADDNFVPVEHDFMTDPQMDEIENSCDGCLVGMPIEDGIHLYRNGLPYMACTKDRYTETKE